MRLETPGKPTDECGSLADAVGAEAPARDRDGGFPDAAFDALRRRGLIGWPPLEPDRIGGLLRLLAEVGRGDLATGRIFEGHVNALFLVRAHGSPAQQRCLGAVAAAGGLFGVWNTDAPDEPLRVVDGSLVGRKNFASGVDGLAQAIVTVPDPAGRVMLMVPLAGLVVDRTWWRPMGMRASGSHIVDFTGLSVEPDWVIGRPGDYVRPPWFSAGAVRFAAVHVGGMHAVFDVAVGHLRQTGRIADPHQAHRVARMGIAVEAGYNWLDRAASSWQAAAADPAADAVPKRLMATANAARTAIEALALDVLETAERAVGAAGMLEPHPLERLVRDLRTYLRQPNPDGALGALGEAIAAGDWRPGEAS